MFAKHDPQEFIKYVSSMSSGPDPDNWVEQKKYFQVRISVLSTLVMQLNN